MSEPSAPADLGALRPWGSDCLVCGNTTPGSMQCDSCKSAANTVALWAEETP